MVNFPGILKKADKPFNFKAHFEAVRQSKQTRRRAANYIDSYFDAIVRHCEFAQW